MLIIIVDEVFIERCVEQKMAFSAKTNIQENHQQFFVFKMVSSIV